MFQFDNILFDMKNSLLCIENDPSTQCVQKNYFLCAIVKIRLINNCYVINL